MFLVELFVCFNVSTSVVVICSFFPLTQWLRIIKCYLMLLVLLKCFIAKSDVSRDSQFNRLSIATVFSLRHCCSFQFHKLCLSAYFSMLLPFSRTVCCYLALHRSPAVPVRRALYPCRQCSRRCDAGVKARTVACVEVGRGSRVPHRYCQAAGRRRPRARRRCRKRRCPFKWVPGAWSEVNCRPVSPHYLPLKQRAR